MQQTLEHKRILLVEDEYFIARDIARVFRSLGAVIVGPISRSEAALDIVSNEAIDAAVLDVGLRGDDKVYPVADALVVKNIPFVFASGYSPTSVPERYRNVPWFEKPADPIRLAKALALFPAAKPDDARMSYSVWAEGAVWHWVLRRNGSIVSRGSTESRIGARAAAMAANPDS